MIRSHFIEYDVRPAYAGDDLLVANLVAGMQMQASPRRYRFVGARDGKTLVNAETVWVLCDASAGRPSRRSQAPGTVFRVVGALRGLRGPQGWGSRYSPPHSGV